MVTPLMSTSILYTSILSLLLLFLLNLIFRLNRNRSSSPLPPGPNPWPIVGNLPHLGPVPHHTLATLAKSFGPLMYLRLGSVDVVVACSASVASKFLKAHDANFASRPTNSGAKHIAYNHQDMVFAPYGPRWQLLRKVSNMHLFSSKAMNAFCYVREEEVARLIRAVASGSSPVNLGQLLNICTTNALARAMLGKRVFSGGGDSSGDHRQADEFKAMVLEVMTLAGVFNIGDFIPALDWFDLQGIRAKMKNLHSRFDSFLTSVLEEHRAHNNNNNNNNSDNTVEGCGKADFLSALISLKEEATSDDAEGVGKLTDIEIKALLLNMFTAGTDTSSSTTEWALAELIRHPKIMAKAQQELDAVVGRDRLVSESDLPRLTYLQAIVKEVFRLHPSTPLSLPRIASESCEIDGYHIPKGATLLVNVWAIARDPSAWSDPLVFRPERFLPGGEKPNVDVKGNDFEVIPFGAGRRICAGLSLGLRMVQLLTATLVHAFEWALPPGLDAEQLNMEEAYGLTLQRAAPLQVHPRPRLMPHIYK